MRPVVEGTLRAPAAARYTGKVVGTDRIEPDKRLRRDVESALRKALDPSDVLPMLHRLARTAAPGSEERVFAHRQLAELLAEKSPWRAAIYAKRVIAERPDDDRGWALLGLSQTLLGHYRFAVTAYEKALACAPKNPWYAHNLGHLLDVALDRAGDAIEWLRTAYAEATELGHAASDDIAASFAHALGRAGRVAEAKKVLVRAMKGGASREHEALLKWLERGAPAAEDAGGPSGPSGAPSAADRGALCADSPSLEGPPRSARAVTKRVRPDAPTARHAASLRRAVDAALSRGLQRLPLDDKQRARARELAQATRGGTAVAEAVSAPPGARTAPEAKAAATGARSVAAAIAYAVVFVDRVPLTPAEVAATFRVSPAALRGRFGELRARLDLTPGDARYATRT
jgi:Flp pilus assembly protein TadD